MIPYSYHTFLLPFEYSGMVSPDVKNRAASTITETKIQAGENYVSDYAMFQYFTPEARKLLFGAKYDYSYSSEMLENEVYVIEKKQGDGAKTFSLPVTSLRVLMHDNGIGLLMLSMENRGYPDINDIAWINEYGRRINLPFLSDAPHKLVAEKITLLGKTADFEELTKEYISSGYTPDGEIIEPIRAVIEEFLGSGSKISPIIDDRMFVCCLIRNDDLSETLKDDGLYSSEQVYRLGFVDASDASCPSNRLRCKILDRCVYDRWAPWGTADAAARRSPLQ